MKVLKKIGWFAASAAPLVLMLALQIIISAGFGAAAGIILTMQSGGGLSPEQMMQQAGAWIMDRYMLILFVTQLISLIPFLLWYYFGLARKQSRIPVKKLFTGRTAGVFILMGAGVYLLAAVFLKGAELAVPDMMEAYNELIEQSGIAELTVLSTIATVVLAPVGEELVFRGLTLHFARRLSGSFLVANIIQAVFFGIAHMNWIQGIYAFGLGLVLGCVRERYGSLYAAMLLHASFNFFGTYLASALGGLPETMPVFAAVLVVGALLTFLAYKLFKTDLEELSRRRSVSEVS